MRHDRTVTLPARDRRVIIRVLLHRAHELRHLIESRARVNDPATDARHTAFDMIEAADRIEPRAVTRFLKEWGTPADWSPCPALEAALDD